MLNIVQTPDKRARAERASLDGEGESVALVPAQEHARR